MQSCDPNNTSHGARQAAASFFSAEHYIDAWRALMEPKGWTDGQIARLEALHASPR